MKEENPSPSPCASSSAATGTCGICASFSRTEVLAIKRGQQRLSTKAGQSTHHPGGSSSRVSEDRSRGWMRKGWTVAQGPPSAQDPRNHIS